MQRIIRGSDLFVNTSFIRSVIFPHLSQLIWKRPFSFLLNCKGVNDPYPPVAAQQLWAWRKRKIIHLKEEQPFKPDGHVKTHNMQIRKDLSRPWVGVVPMCIIVTLQNKLQSPRSFFEDISTNSITPWI